MDAGSIISSAGTAAGVDACLHLVRRELGSHIATRIARRMVVPPLRDGGQQQFVDTPIPEHRSDRLAPLLDWVAGNLAMDHTVESLADRAAMSPRTFARRFVAEIGPASGLTVRLLDPGVRRHLCDNPNRPANSAGVRATAMAPCSSPGAP